MVLPCAETWGTVMSKPNGGRIDLTKFEAKPRIKLVTS